LNLKSICKSLQQKEFARLYTAQTISLLGDAFTWVGVALLAYEFAGANASVVLSAALTLRVTAFILFAPYAGVLADKFNRKTILLIADFGRMVVVACVALVNASWQLYILIFILNIFSAFFTPAYKASVPQMIKSKEGFAPAIALSNATYQLLAVMGPGIAGAAAAWLGSRQIFFADAFSYLLSALLILGIANRMFALPVTQSGVSIKKENQWIQITKGTKLLFGDKAIRFALLVELAAAIAGANILVNTVGYVKGTLQQSDQRYGWVMSALGIGAAIAVFGVALLDKSKERKPTLIAGCLLLGAAIMPAKFVSFIPLLLLWFVAGLGQNLAEMPSQMLIAERIPPEQQGRVYGAHYAWSHAWWAIGYPVAGFLGTQYSSNSFLIAGAITLLLLFIIIFLHLSNKRNEV
jgi:MFS transporter, NRE family, putaive nickel resistance protein